MKPVTPWTRLAMRKDTFVAFLALAWAILTTNGATTLPKIRVATENGSFLTSKGDTFMPFGINYFRPGTGWAPQVWRQFDPEATRGDFERLKRMGGNCVRVFLTYGSFMNEPGKLEPEGLRKWDQFVKLAEAAGLYVHPTGPDHWEGLPTWARKDRYADETVLAALESFWTQFARHNRGRSVIFAYDLLNEPEVPWETESMRRRWGSWAQKRYPTLRHLAEAWGLSETSLSWENLAIPKQQDAPNHPHLLDYQRFREDIADEWTRRQATAIRRGDPEALVTVGLIQWSVPIVLAHAQHYSAFKPERQAPFLDFLEVHFYPLAQGMLEYKSLEEELKNLAYAEAVVREVARSKRPVVLAEFGWYGGGTLDLANAKPAPGTEEDQARWCRRLVEVTAPWVSGWLNWGFFDQPEAKDVSQLIGLLTATGDTKAWGRVFTELSNQLPSLQQRQRQAESLSRPALDWSQAVTSGESRRHFQTAYEQAFMASQGSAALRP